MVMKARNLFGPKKARRVRQTTPPAPKTQRQRLIGKVSATPKAPKRVLPTRVGPGPDPELLALFDGADGLGECNRRLKVARPELDEPARFALLQAHFAAMNIRWLASGKSGARKELTRLASRNPTGFETDFVDDGPTPAATTNDAK